MSAFLGKIHNWLYNKIQLHEILNSNTLNKNDIADIFKNNAMQLSKQIDINDRAPQDIFTLIFDYMLEGMPCDRVNEIIENNSTKISWKTTRCLHEDYWNEVGGDINNNYFFRDSWINGFINTSCTNYRYDRTKDAISTIERT